MRGLILVILVLAAACGNPPVKRVDPEPSAQPTNNGDTNTPEDQTGSGDGCGVTTCDDGNACTLDSGEQNTSTCVTTCSYEREVTCVDGDGCCPAACDPSSDSDCDGTNVDQCPTTCRPPADACTTVISTKDQQGCVTGCDYAPVSSCVSGDGCCPNGCTAAMDADCGDRPDGNPVDNGHGANNGACVPATCDTLGAECGATSDGCGGTVNCGSCANGDSCIDAVCHSVVASCDPNVSGTCPTEAPYCLDGKCAECIGVADCTGDEICDGGFCRPTPDCNSNPGLCPDGYVCNAGTCEAPVGKGCDPNDPQSCGGGTFCDPGTSTCISAGGDLGCGFCGEDCTCPSGTCDGFLCSCTGTTDNPFGECPEGQFCLAPLFPICFPQT